ncbi:MerR family transcriptional regulator [Nocardia yamanashiensis]|uniref:MerR family transcriptional regulator n=1 Tax=Nocardia yamanashiensis TaxID=209247 RepID=UPI0008363691|nr:MerR family transcriptional regulator [Nocardia yamanashiensis]
MQISELAAQSGVPLPTVKFYLRTGVLMPGEATSATRAVYGEPHLRRIALIKALSHLGVPMTRIKSITEVIDQQDLPLLDALAVATASLPPAVESTPDPVYPRARAILTSLGYSVPDDYPAVAQLELGLAAAEAAGLPLDEARLHVYAPHIMSIAVYDIDHLPVETPSEAIEYAVLGTALYEPILAALRRISHAELATRRLT